MRAGCWAREASDDLPTLTNRNGYGASPPHRQSRRALSIVTIHSIWTYRAYFALRHGPSSRHRRPSNDLGAEM